MSHGPQRKNWKHYSPFKLQFRACGSVLSQELQSTLSEPILSDIRKSRKELSIFLLQNFSLRLQSTLYELSLTDALGLVLERGEGGQPGQPEDAALDASGD